VRETTAPDYNFTVYSSTLLTLARNCIDLCNSHALLHMQLYNKTLEQLNLESRITLSCNPEKDCAGGSRKVSF
jgi:hypothetical protein